MEKGLGLCAVLLSSACALCQVRYSVVDLGDLGGGQTVPVRINPSGQIVGSSRTADGQTHAFLWEKDRIRDLGCLPQGKRSYAADISDAGQVVGWSESPKSYGDPFVWEKGRMTAIIPRNPRSPSSSYYYAHGSMICKDLAVLSAYTSRTSLILVRLQDGQHLYLGGLAASRVRAIVPLGASRPVEVSRGSRTVSDIKASRINGQGLVAGSYRVGSLKNTRACLFSPSVEDELRWVILDIVGPSELLSSEAEDLTQDGSAVAGWCGTSEADPSLRHAALWTKEGRGWRMTDLGALGGGKSWATALNVKLQVVGCSQTPDGSERAFLYEKKKMLDLNLAVPPDSGWVLESATDISDSGWIIGVGTIMGVRRGYLLKPSSN